MEGVKHILRGEDAYTHGWMWDSLPDGCLPDFLKGNKEALCLTAASGILRIKAGGNIWQVQRKRTCNTYAIPQPPPPTHTHIHIYTHTHKHMPNLLTCSLL